jgi:hypothetical protein
MRLNHLKSKLRTLSSLEDTPDVIVLHVAGNDLGAYEIGDLRYLSRVKFAPPGRFIILACSHARLMIEDSKIQTEVFPEIFDEI